MPDGRILTTLVMAAIFAGFVGVATTLPSQAAFMPYLVGIPGLLLCLAQLVLDLRTPAAEPDRTVKGKRAEDARTETQMFLWLTLFTAAIVGFGFVWGGPVIVGLFVRFNSRESWANALFAAAGTLAVIWGVFVWLLQLRMFEGLVLRALF